MPTATTSPIETVIVATPPPTSTPATTPVPLPTATPGLPGGECLHCWIYVSPEPPLPTAPEYSATEVFLRENYSVTTPRVGTCDECPWVYDLSMGIAPVMDGVLYPTEAPVGDGRSTLVLSFHPRVTGTIDAMALNHRAVTLRNGWMVPITAEHNIWDVAGMLVHPIQLYPRHAVGSLALTNSGYAEVVASLETGLAPGSVDQPIPECLHCWRYVIRALPETDPAFVRTERNLQARFTGSGGNTTCATCPWVLPSEPAPGAGNARTSDPRTVATRNNILDHRRAVTAADGRQRVNIASLHQSARYVFGPDPVGAGYVTRIGAGYSAEQAARMLAWPEDGLVDLSPSSLVVTQRGIDALMEPRTPVRPPWGLVTFSQLPVTFCTLVPDDATDDERARFSAVMQAGMDNWETALGITPFGLSGPCPDAVDPDNVGNNGYTEAVLTDTDSIGVATGGRISETEALIRMERQPFNQRAGTSCSVIAATHELGHVLGFDHTPVESSIMYDHGVYSVALGDCRATRHIQDWEVRQLLRWWGLE
ncbi:MAG: matrixin family metalloprotease [Chloroflexi bacterium]|nr:matrixin family metalloprotease [Chloroflexota bacterium]